MSVGVKSLMSRPPVRITRSAINANMAISPPTVNAKFFVYPLRCLHNFVSDFIYRFVVRDFFFGFRFYYVAYFNTVGKVRISYNFFPFFMRKASVVAEQLQKAISE